MKKMLNVMLKVQKEMVLEKNAIEVDLEITSGVLEESVGIVQDLILDGEFEEAKAILDDCSKLQQKQDELETLLVNKQYDYVVLEDMIEEVKRLIAKYEIDNTKHQEEVASSLEDLLAALVLAARE